MNINKFFNSTLFFFILLIIFFSCTNNGDISLSKKDGMTNEIIKDIDGNSYRVVKIGTQYWLADNFRST